MAKIKMIRVIVFEGDASWPTEALSMDWLNPGEVKEVTFGKFYEASRTILPISDVPKEINNG